MLKTAATELLRRTLEGIRDETKLYANTANRIGNALLALLSFIEGAPFLRKDMDDSTTHTLGMGNAHVEGDASIKGDAIVGKGRLRLGSCRIRCEDRQGRQHGG